MRRSRTQDKGALVTSITSDLTASNATLVENNGMKRQ